MAGFGVHDDSEIYDDCRCSPSNRLMCPKGHMTIKNEFQVVQKSQRHAMSNVSRTMMGTKNLLEFVMERLLGRLNFVCGFDMRFVAGCCTPSGFVYKLKKLFIISIQTESL